MKVIKPIERFTSNDHKLAKSTNGDSSELYPFSFTPQFKEKQKLSIIAAGLLPDKNPIKRETIS